MIETLREKVEPKLLKLRGVVGVSHTHQSKNKIIIYVESEKDVKRMPKLLAGVPVEPIVVGRVKALPLLKTETTQKVRPIVGGVSIGPPLEVAGTLGVIIDGLILTNAHVIALDFQNVDWYPLGTPIYQPSWLDGGTKDDVIGHLIQHSRIVFNAIYYNTADVAVAQPTVDFKEMEILRIGKLNGIKQPENGMKVKKCGRTTGLTKSEIIDTNATMKVDYGPFGIAIFKNCIVTKPAMAQGGDSGSALVTEDNYLVGLIFAGSEYVTVANSMANVFTSLEVREGIPVALLIPIAVTGAVSAYYWRWFG